MDGVLSNPVGGGAVALLVLLLALSLLGLAQAWRWAERSGPALWSRALDRWGPPAAAPPIAWLRDRAPRLYRFLARRLSAEGYLGLHLTLGLALIAAGIGAFAGLADDMAEGGGLAAADMAVVDALGQGAAPGAVAFFRAVTHLGDPPLLAAIGLAVGALLALRRRWLLLISWGVALAGGGLLNLQLKALFQRARPTLPNPFVEPSGWSFPSGHAMGAMIAYGMLAYLAARTLDRRWRRPVALLAAGLVLLIGLSRVYLGAHFVSDVLAGFAAGSAWVAVCITGAETARRHYRRRRAPAVTADTPPE